VGHGVNGVRQDSQWSETECIGNQDGVIERKEKKVITHATLSDQGTQNDQSKLLAHPLSCKIVIFSFNIGFTGWYAGGN